LLRQPYKAISNEIKYPYIVELVVADDKLDVELGRRIMNFHRSRKIQARHGRTIEGKARNYFRWCFSDSDMASAFKEQFGGKLTRGGQTERRRG
jgi:hypothetical protein